MTQENKELLIKDLCARLPYGVCYEHFTWDDECGEDCVAAQICSINTDGYVKNCYDDETVYIDNVRPYLFPLSSMTEEQKKTLKVLCDWNDEEADAQSILVLYQKHFVMKSDVIDWLHKNHFDYRGLIEKGIAIDATGLNIY